MSENKEPPTAAAAVDKSERTDPATAATARKGDPARRRRGDAAALRLHLSPSAARDKRGVQRKQASQYKKTSREFAFALLLLLFLWKDNGDGEKEN